MKKSNRTVRKMRSAWTGFAAACLAAALTMSALASCAPQESRPVVTSDDLTPPSAAQEAIAQEAGGGKNYAYYWQAENAEETLQMLREAYEQEVNDAKELIAKGEEAVKAAGYPSLAEAQQAVDARQELARRLGGVPGLRRLQAVVAVAAGSRMRFAEIGQQCLSTTPGGFAKADQRVELAVLQPLALVAGLAFTDHPPQLHRIAQAVGQPRVGRLAVAAGAAGFLVIAFQ